MSILVEAKVVYMYILDGKRCPQFMGVLIEGFMCIMFTNLPLHREPTSLQGATSSSRPTRHRVATHHSSRVNNTSNSSSLVGHRALHSGTEWSLAVCSTNCNITRDHKFFSIM